MKTKHYRGWDYSYDRNRPVTGRWRAKRAGVGMGHTTEEGLRRMIDVRVTEEEVDSLEERAKYDFRIDDHGSILLFVPLNDAAKAWVRETAPEDAQFWTHDQLVVEPRYMDGVVQAAQVAGFSVIAIA